MIIADDHHVVRAGMRHLLKKKSHWQMVGEASCPAQPMEMLTTRHCDLLRLLLAIAHAPRWRPNGKRIRARYPALKILAMIMLSNPALLNRIRDAGAGAVVKKH